jgi:hypothetical protein
MLILMSTLRVFEFCCKQYLEIEYCMQFFGKFMLARAFRVNVVGSVGLAHEVPSNSGENCGTTCAFIESGGFG